MRPPLLRLGESLPLADCGPSPCSVTRVYNRFYTFDVYAENAQAPWTESKLDIAAEIQRRKSKHLAFFLRRTCDRLMLLQPPSSQHHHVRH